MCVFPSSSPLFLLSLFFLLLLIDPIQNLPWVTVWVTLCRASIHPSIQLFVLSPSYSLVIYPSTHTSIHLLVYYPASQSLICIHWYIHLSVFLASQHTRVCPSSFKHIAGVSILCWIQFNCFYKMSFNLCLTQSMGSMRVGRNWATSLSRIGEGNGNPLQCSCLENPRDGGAWWAAVYGVAQSQTRLKWLSSSSSSWEIQVKKNGDGAGQEHRILFLKNVSSQCITSGGTCHFVSLVVIFTKFLPLQNTNISV